MARLSAGLCHAGSLPLCNAQSAPTNPTSASDPTASQVVPEIVNKCRCRGERPNDYRSPADSLPVTTGQPCHASGGVLALMAALQQEVARR
jgi:hypothetical protein